VWKLEQFERSMIADPMHIADMPPLSIFPSPSHPASSCASQKQMCNSSSNTSNNNNALQQQLIRLRVSAF